jgi:hypothetical protein
MKQQNRRGRRAIDGVQGVTARVNIVLTEEHRKKLEKLAPEGMSPWVRAMIDKEWSQHK